ncbi:electron transfer flavoprotein subunit alpha/FixB family protein [Halodesulfurarchaeum sp. HSR-GB]|uniref:electron transfer flavoprotein subunit alpha/FixB family protein n=1 Tax=Halodesulfurarchaeum sp. HSR-GB TaxID=3074077 RepID=UPI00285C25F7|nr:electron transfer flavoprotein subunit alpha/FixB family protein [Halodesulfurarchaeum sp. HSR-GB]MDR5655990.1 electron transfer flavoprotein subunit alpha/FixB family protein [Halodesulfurarchaeum sp. HSR-GB]
MPGEVDTADYADVWVFIEQHDGEAAKVSWELLAKGRELADEKGERLVALVMGESVTHLAEEAIERGADEVLVAEDPIFEPYLPGPYGEQFRYLVEERHPDVVLIGGSHTGRDFAGRVAVPTYAGLTADCTELDIEPDTGLLLAKRPTFGGDAMATIKCVEHRPQMATVRPGVFDAAEPDPDREGTITEVEVVVDESHQHSRMIERVVGDITDITDANVVVAGGYGTEGDFGPIEDLAAALGGEVAATREAVEEGWIEAARQVGQTGKTVKPDLYIACGISGAIQHLEGMNDSKTIVAINDDPNAPIFDDADYGIVGDLFEVCPALTELIEQKRGETA